MVLAHAVGSVEFYWAVIAELSLVIWTALLLLAPRRGSRRAHGRRFRLSAFGAAVLASLITLAGKLVEVWPGNPLFPSGHTAYAVTIAALLVACDRRWIAPVIALGCLLVVALLRARYHVPWDIAGGAGVGGAVAASVLAWQRASRPRGAQPW